MLIIVSFYFFVRVHIRQFDIKLYKVLNDLTLFEYRFIKLTHINFDNSYNILFMPFN